MQLFPLPPKLRPFALAIWGGELHSPPVMTRLRQPLLRFWVRWFCLLAICALSSMASALAEDRPSVLNVVQWKITVIKRLEGQK